MAWPDAFNDDDSVAIFANGFVGFGGAGIAYTGIPAPAAWPAVGCDVTGPCPPICTSSRSLNSSYKNAKMI